MQLLCGLASLQEPLSWLHRSCSHPRQASSSHHLAVQLDHDFFNGVELKRLGGVDLLLLQVQQLRDFTRTSTAAPFFAEPTLAKLTGRSLVAGMARRWRKSSLTTLLSTSA